MFHQASGGAGGDYVAASKRHRCASVRQRVDGLDTKAAAAAAAAVAIVYVVYCKRAGGRHYGGIRPAELAVGRGT